MNIEKLVSECKKAAPTLGTLSTQKKNSVLKDMATQLRANTSLIIKTNLKDLKNGEKKKLTQAFLDRLKLDEKRIESMARGLEEVAVLADPVGEVVKEWTRPNGLQISKVRIPLGVIGVVYESRPNVTVDAAGLCFKSGNGVVLRGGSEAFESNKILVQILQKVLKKNGLPQNLITFIPTTDRIALKKILQLSKWIDVIIPRGGESLMKFMEENSKIPVIKHDKGVCHLFVDETADVAKALLIAENAKVQRPGVCNALESLLVHQKIAKRFMPLFVKRFLELGVEIRGDASSRKFSSQIKKATEKDWDTEYLDLVLSVKIVSSIDEAILHIRKHGSLHTEAIVTENKSNADQFVRDLDSSCVLVNASTRFNDGGELGLGAEIGISTTKLHAFGPMGLEELTSTKFVVYGSGQIRV